MLGKQKCRILKEIRQRIADENDIPFVTQECRHRGECSGTCPRCESELRYLEQQLDRRAALGKRITVAALCAGIAFTGAGCVQDVPVITPAPGEQLSGEVAPYETVVPSEEPELETSEVAPASDHSPAYSTASPGTNPVDVEEFELSGMVPYWALDIGKMKPVYPLLALARLRMGIDGKGVTTLVAGAGCPLQCQWCINKRLLREGMPTLVSPEQLLDRVRIDDLYFRATGGGITFGGGEPLLHADFLYEFCSSAPSGWTICVETSLHVPQRNVQIVADIADEFIVDCKDMNPQIYRKYTGGNEKLMESNLKFLLQTVGAGHIHVRVPHIPGYNTEADQANSAKRLKAIGFQDPELFTYTVRD